MSRLTHYLKDGRTAAEPKNRAEGLAFAAKLAGYEDLEENGLLIKLPCKVGDEVWCVIDCTSHNTLFIREGVYKCTIRNFEIKKYGVFANITITRRREWHLEDDIYELYVKVETIFITREAAEKALKERECDG